MFSPIEAIQLATVLSDCVDQLSNIGKLMPALSNYVPTTDEIIEDPELQLLYEAQELLEKNLDEAINKASKLLEVKNVDGEPEFNLKEAGVELRYHGKPPPSPVPQSSLLQDVMEKMHSDRLFLQEIIEIAADEMLHGGTYILLTETVEEENKIKERVNSAIERELEMCQNCKQLHLDIDAAKKERAKVIRTRMDQISHLKDYLQELKVLRDNEIRYSRKFSEINLLQTQKFYDTTQQWVKDEIERTRVHMEEENRVNTELQSFLKVRIQERHDLLNYWINKYEYEVDLKQKELAALKAQRQKNMDWFIELSKRFIEYQQVVSDDLRQKKIISDKIEQDELENRTATMIQAWWRGTMVRRCYGPYKKKKEKKGKKGKKK